MATLGQILASKGRNGDTILAHINPEEAALLKAHGGSGTINPKTGLPEFSFWTSARHVVEQPFKSVAKLPFIQPIADVAALATGNPELIPLINGGLTYANTGSFGQGLKAGGEAFALQEAAPAFGNAFSNAFPETAASLGVGGGANSLTDLLGQTTGGGSLTGPGTIGGDALGITNATGFTNSPGGASTMLSRALTAGNDNSLAPSVMGGTANNAPLSGGSSSGAVPSNNLSSPTLSSSGGGASSYDSGSVLNSTDLSAADPSLTNKFPLGTGVGGTSNGGFNYDINGNSAGGSSYSAPTQLSNSIGSAISPENVVTGGPKVGSGTNMLGTLLGGANSLYANNQAQKALVSGQNKALTQLQPYLQSGGAANTQLSDLLGTSDNTGAAGYGTLGQPFNPGDLTKTPGYNFALDQGNQELDRQNAARGGYFSGGAIKAGQDFAQNLATTTYQQQLQDYLAQQQQQYGMLSGQAGVGANAANNAGTIFGNVGAARANADVANANVFGGTLGSMLGSGKTPINIGGKIVYI